MPRKWRRKQKMEGTYQLSRDRKREIGEKLPQAIAARKRKARLRYAVACLGREVKAMQERKQNERMLQASAVREEIERQTAFYEKQVNPKTMPKWLR